MPFVALALAIAVVAAVFAAAKAPASAPKAKDLPTPSPASTKPTIATLTAAWPGYIVIDIAKYKTIYNPPPSNAPFAAIGAEPYKALNVPSTNVGTVPVFLAAQLAAKKRVWVGPSELDPTAEKPENVLPFYVGTTPPPGYIEVVS